MRPLILAAALTFAACSSTQVTDTPTSGSPPLCASAGDIGPLLVAPQTHWRADQKEPAKREAIAQAAIEASFKSVPCAKQVRILPIAKETSLDAVRAAAHGERTAVIIRVEELGPIFIISIPALWSGWSDVKFDFTVVDLITGQTRFSLERHRKIGGPFIVRGVAPLQGEMEQALKGLIAK